MDWLALAPRKGLRDRGISRYSGVIAGVAVFAFLGACQHEGARPVVSIRGSGKPALARERRARAFSWDPIRGSH